MAKKQKKVQSNQNLEVVENVLSRTEQWIEDNQKTLTYIIVGIVVVVGGYIGFKKLYVAPRELSAQSEMFMAEKYFEKDSFRLALDGDGNYPGFLDIIDDYGSTKSANLSKYYAGISFIKLGDFESAIEYLSDYKLNDNVVGSLSLGLTGDAYLELGENEQAVKYYLRAANLKENQFSTPTFLFKAGLVYEEMGDFEKALELYEKILTDFTTSNEGRNMEKYIARVNILIQNAE